MLKPILFTPEEVTHICDAVRELVHDKFLPSLNPDFCAYVLRCAYDGRSIEDTRRFHAHVDPRWESGYSVFFPIGKKAQQLGLDFKEVMKIAAEHGAVAAYRMLFNEDPQTLKRPVSRN